MGQTTTDLISQIKLQGSFPSSDSLFSNANYLSMLNSEISKEIVPLLNKINEEYFLISQDITVTPDKKYYRIPARAVGSALRDVQLVTSSSNVVSLTRLYEENRTSVSGNQQGYFLRSNLVEISPIPTNSSDILKLLYFRRPSKFVLPSACAQIESIDTVLKQVVVSSLPSVMTTNTLVDFVQANSPYDILEMDYEISGVSGTTISFTELPEDLAQGDYICLAGESCVPMVPEELVPVLVQAALCTALSSKKDKSVELELQKLTQMKESILEMLSPRVKSNDKKVVNQNSFLWK